MGEDTCSSCPGSQLPVGVRAAGDMGGGGMEGAGQSSRTAPPSECAVVVQKNSFSSDACDTWLFLAGTVAAGKGSDGS